MAASKVFREQLYRLGHGLPMWEPECEVHIGDVGYFKRTDGTFCRLFNILVPHDDSANPRGVPESFSPFIASQYDWTGGRREHYFRPGVPLMSEKVVVLDGQVGFQMLG
jgi:hypothetical protein